MGRSGGVLSQRRVTKPEEVATTRHISWTRPEQAFGRCGLGIARVAAPRVNRQDFLLADDDPEAERNLNATLSTSTRGSLSPVSTLRTGTRPITTMTAAPGHVELDAARHRLD